MPTSVGGIYVDVKANTKPFQQQMTGFKAVAANIAGKIGKIFAAAMAVKVVADFGKQCVDLASDLNEVQNVVDVTFPTMAARINEWAAAASDTFGLSETMAKKFTGNFGSMAEAFGFTESQAYDMSTALAGLAGDVASFYNISQDEAFTKLKSVFSGETESLKQLGIVMTQSALDAYALANGYGQSVSAMTEQEKVALRLAFVQDHLANASGDFARTSGSWANQTRLLTLRFQELKANIGQSLIAVLLPVVRVINAVIAGLNQAAKAVGRFIEAITGKSMGELTGGVSQVAVEAGGAAETAAGGVDDLAAAQDKAAGAAKAQDKAQKALNRTLAGFDKINKLNSEAAASSGGSGGSGGGSAGGGIGLGDSVASEATKAQSALDKLKLPQSLVDAVNHAKTAFSNFFGVLRDMGGWIVENVLKPLGKWTMNELAPRVVELVAAAFDVLTETLKALQPVWQVLFDNVIKPLAAFIGDVFCSALDVLIGWWNALAGIIKNYVAPAFKVLSDFWSKTFGPVIKTLIEIMQDWFDRWKTWIGDRIQAALPHLKKIADMIGGALTKAFEWLGDALSGMGPALKEAWDWLMKKLDPAFQKLGEVIDGFWPMLENVCKWIGDHIPDAVEFGKKAFDALGKVAKWLWNNVLKPLGKFLSGVFKGALNALKKPLEVISGAFDALGKAAKWVWDNVLKPIADFFNKTFGGAIDDASDAIGGFKGVWDGISSKTVELGAAIKSGAETVIGGFKGAWDGIKDKAVELGAKLATTANDVKTWWTNTTDGWKDKWADLTAKASTAASSVSSWWSGVTAGWKDKASSLSLTNGTLIDSVKSWWNDRSKQWKPKTSNFSLKNATLLSSVKSWWNDRSNAWKAKTSKFGLNNSTKLSSVKSWWSDRAAAWKERWQNFGMNNATKLDTVRGWWNDRAALWKDKTAEFKIKAVKDPNSIKGVRVTSYTSAANAPTEWRVEEFAKGGFVARNTPRLAIVGDNRREGEIISPESKFQSMLDKAAGGNDVSALLPVLNDILNAIQTSGDVYLDGREITRTVVSNVNAQTRATGRSAIIV